MTYDRSRELLKVSGGNAREVEAVAKSLLGFLESNKEFQGGVPLDAAVEHIAAALRLEHKRTEGQFDVFLCHNNVDKTDVKAIGKRLMELGCLPWLDEWNLQPGLPWQAALETEITKIKSAAVIVGQNGIGPWQDMEIEGILREFIRRKCPVIPVILPSCTSIPELPLFLGGFTWVDFRKMEPDPLRQLIWGITGSL